MGSNNKCEICGQQSTTALVDGTDVCEKCSTRYSVTYCTYCKICGGKSTGIGIEPDEICDRCKAEIKVENMNPEVWDKIDPLILSNDIITANMKLVDTLGISLSEAQDIFGVRYRYLREHKPDEFSCSHDDYWKGYYS